MCIRDSIHIYIYISKEQQIHPDYHQYIMSYQFIDTQVPPYINRYPENEQIPLRNRNYEYYYKNINSPYIEYERKKQIDEAIKSEDYWNNMGNSRGELVYSSDLNQFYKDKYFRQQYPQYQDTIDFNPRTSYLYKKFPDYDPTWYQMYVTKLKQKDVEMDYQLRYPNYTREYDDLYDNYLKERNFLRDQYDFYGYQNYCQRMRQQDLNSRYGYPIQGQYYSQNVMEPIIEEEVEYIPVEKKITQYQPVEKVQRQIIPVETQIELIPQIKQEKQIQYVPVEKIREIVQYQQVEKINSKLIESKIESKEIINSQLPKRSIMVSQQSPQQFVANKVIINSPTSQISSQLLQKNAYSSQFQVQSQNVGLIKNQLLQKEQKQ
eukprot:TRINITY_DN511_c0_g1_i11.p1 TRINITY_DN511_c0_g1~~TRINITY_DN511_c0_g1_i11.p1  ORF type:complete len:377 (+),score=62.59 TRINITY_DN511_c0_g1_i11:177-1307(+)